MERTGSPRSGVTLTEVLLVFVLISVLVVVLGALVLPQINGNGPSHQQVCGKNLSQILGACVAYSTTEEAPWPTPWPKAQDLSAIHIADAHEARLTTVHMMSILARVQDLPNRLFKCPGNAQAGPQGKPAFDRAGALAWGAAPGRSIQYAWDWASPDEPGSARVVGADRSPAHHKGKAMAVFGDSHTKALKVLAGAATGMVTEDSEGSPVTAGIVNPDATGASGAVDDIYSSAGDGGFPLQPAGGDPLRAWVK